MMTRDEALGYAVDTESFLSGDVLDEAPLLVRKHFPGKRVLLVADGNTWHAAGERLLSIFDAAGVPADMPYLWEGDEKLSPDVAHVPPLQERIHPDIHAVVAVGSGTVNDIVKAAAFEAGVRYMIVATAASVDGYTSPGASMVIDGFKQSLYCRAPVAVLADTSILASAPADMLSAGYGDLASKITAGADWIIADELGIDSIDPVCKRMIQDDLLHWLDHPSGAARGARNSLDRVMYGLTLSGIGMQYLRRSRPASGAEHLMSHIWDMKHHRYKGKSVSHGFQVAVATLAVTAFMERLFARTPSSEEIEERIAEWPTWEEREEEIRREFAAFGSIDAIVGESRAKYLDAPALKERLERVVTRWDRLSARVLERLLPYSELRQRFDDAACPTASGAIGLTREALLHTFALSGMIRNRYTAVDLAWEIGRLPAITAELAESEEYGL